MVETLKQTRSICSQCGEIVSATYEVRAIDMIRIERCYFHNASPRGVMSFCALNARRRHAQPHAQESAFVPLPTRRSKQQTISVE